MNTQLFCFFPGISFSLPHNPTLTATATNTSHRVKPQRLFNTHNFYLTQPIMPGTAHIHTNTFVSGCCSLISAQNCAELGGHAALTASAVTHGLRESVILPDVPLAFPVEHSPRTHSTFHCWTPSFQNTVPTAHKVLTSNPLLHDQLGKLANATAAASQSLV